MWSLGEDRSPRSSTELDIESHGLPPQECRSIVECAHSLPSQETSFLVLLGGAISKARGNSERKVTWHTWTSRELCLVGPFPIPSTLLTQREHDLCPTHQPLDVRLSKAKESATDTEALLETLIAQPSPILPAPPHSFLDHSTHAPSPPIASHHQPASNRVSM